MSDMIKCVVECDSLYGIIALLIFLSFLGLVSILVYKIIIFLIKCISKYKDIHAKACVDNVSVEADLHR